MRYPNVFTLVNHVLRIQENPTSFSELDWSSQEEILLEKGAKPLLDFLEAAISPFSSEASIIEQIATGEDLLPLPECLRETVDTGVDQLHQMLSF